MELLHDDPRAYERDPATRPRLRRGYRDSEASKAVRERINKRTEKDRDRAKEKMAQVYGLTQRSQQRQADTLNQLNTLGFSAAVKALAQTKATQQENPGPRDGEMREQAQPGGKWAKYLANANGIKGLAKRIEKLGFNVGELEGFQGTGEVTGGHTEGSLHYAGLGMDITGDKLGRLFRALKKAYGPDIIDEMFYKDKYYGYGEGPVDNHDNHVHVGTTKRKWG